jgi:ribosome recycling factor
MTDELVSEQLELLQMEMDERLSAFKKQLAKVRTGRANLAMLDGVKADYYGTPTPLNQMATLSVPEANLIVITPWDKSAIAGIERAITSADIGINPTNDGAVIRLVVPRLTGERRQELVKQVRKYTEECKVALRQTRRSCNESLKKMHKDSEIGEDVYKTALDKVQGVTDQAVKRADDVRDLKEKEILEV